MKKIVVFLWLVIFSVASFGQQNDSTTTIMKPDYLKKSKNQKIWAWVLTGGSVVVFVGAVAHDLNNVLTDAPASTGWYLTSVAMLTTGVSLFIAFAVNRKKANKVSFFMNIENVPTLHGTLITDHATPSVGLSIKLKRFDFKF